MTTPKPSGARCEVLAGAPRDLTTHCDRPAVLRYPAMGGGWMYLCEADGARHLKYCERWDGARWTVPPEAAYLLRGERSEGAPA